MTENGGPGRTSQSHPDNSYSYCCLLSNKTIRLLVYLYKINVQVGEWWRYTKKNLEEWTSPLLYSLGNIFCHPTYLYGRE